MHATVASIRFASAAAVEFLAGPSGTGTKAMYKMPTTMAPANVVKNAVTILSFMVAPQQLCHYVTLRQFCAFLRACRAMQFFRPPIGPGNPRADRVRSIEIVSPLADRRLGAMTDVAVVRPVRIQVRKVTETSTGVHRRHPQHALRPHQQRQRDA
jgi:hypothetical protein